MPRLRGKDLSSLYPRAKSFDELEAERKLRQLQRRPRHVSVKIGLWTTFGVATLVVIYRFILHILANNLSSEGGVLFATSFSILLILITGATSMYLYSLINTLATKVLLSTTILYAEIVLILVVAGLILTVPTQNPQEDILIIISALGFNFLMTYLAVNSTIKRQS